MQITCPCCNARYPLDAALQDAAAREAIATALKLPAGLGDLLPGWMREMARDVGLQAVLRLVEARGGGDIYVPGRRPEQSLLQGIVGHAGASWLSAQFGDTRLTVPKCISYLYAARNRDIIDRWLSGESAFSIAVLYGLTERRVRQILAAAEVQNSDRRQAALF